jgi:CubicO group peptidase (beta-lactamase class C family)
MEHTYLFENIHDNRPKSLYYKNRELLIPLAMSSFGADGGMVSTSQDMLVFIKSFFNGIFFPVHYIEQLKTWNRIFFPMRSGIGIHLFKLPFVFNPFRTIPELIGHSGLSGALAFANPARELYMAGTVNQIAFPATSFQLAIKLIRNII